jgi:hypothetical protein
MLNALAVAGIVLLVGLGGTAGVFAARKASKPQGSPQAASKQTRIAITTVWVAAIVAGFLLLLLAN